MHKQNMSTMNQNHTIQVSKMQTEIIIIAAGKGTRMVSNIPKVMHKIAGIPILAYVLNTATALLQQISGRITLVVNKSLLSCNTFQQMIDQYDEIRVVIQEEQLGTGHAVYCALQHSKKADTEKQKTSKKSIETDENIEQNAALILYGDVPLIGVETLIAMFPLLTENLASINLAFYTENPSGYGRIITNDIFYKNHKKNINTQNDYDCSHNLMEKVNNNFGHLHSIVEDKDCNNTQKEIALCNSGICLVRYEVLKNFLDQKCYSFYHDKIDIDSIIDNPFTKDFVKDFLIQDSSIQTSTTESSYSKQTFQGQSDFSIKEIYLTDLPEFVNSSVHDLKSMWLEVNEQEIIGINNRHQLSIAEQIVQRKLRYHYMMSGVTMIDPNTVFLSSNSIIGHDVIIHPNVWIGPNVKIDSGVQIMSFSHIEGGEIRSGSTIGPFARIRPNSIVGINCRIGNFVEIKNCTTANGVKISHLSYAGDVTIGENSNIGAGTIFCNFDGKNKHSSIIGSKVSIGSNSSIISPIIIEDDAIVAAGSTVTDNIPKNHIAFARVKQNNFIRKSKKTEKNT